MQVSAYPHPKQVDKAGLSRRSKLPEVPAPMSSTVNLNSSSRTRVRATDLEAKIHSAHEAAHMQAKTLEVDKTNYGIFTLWSSELTLTPSR